MGHHEFRSHLTMFWHLFTRRACVWSFGRKLLAIHCRPHIYRFVTFCHVLPAKCTNVTTPLISSVIRVTRKKGWYGSVCVGPKPNYLYRWNCPMNIKRASAKSHIDWPADHFVGRIDFPGNMRKFWHMPRSSKTCEIFDNGGVNKHLIDLICKHTVFNFSQATVPKLIWKVPL